MRNQGGGLIMVNQPTAELLLSSRANLRPAFPSVAFHKLYRTSVVNSYLGKLRTIQKLSIDRPRRPDMIHALNTRPKVRTA